MTVQTEAVDEVRRSTAALAIAGVAGGFAVGTAFGQTSLPAVRAAGTTGSLLVLNPVLLLVPVMLVAASLATAVLAGRWGLLTSAIALFAAFAEGEAIGLPVGAAVLVTATLLGVSVGGLMGAFGTADTASRAGLAGGFAAGAVAGHYLLSALLASYQRQLNPPIRAESLVLVGAAVCVAVAATVWLVKRPPEVSSWPTRTRAAVAAAIATAIVAGAMVASLIVHTVADNLRRSRTGGATARRVEFVETAQEVALLLVVAVAALAIAWLAFRRGGPQLARWAVVGLALGAAPLGVSTEGGIWFAVGVLGAAVGTVLARVDRGLVPWDGIGLVVLAIALVLSSRRGRMELGDGSLVAQGLGIFAAALVLAAALSALTTVEAFDRLGPPASAAVALGLGPATWVVSANTVGSHFAFRAGGYGDAASGPAITIGLAALVVFGLYGVGRLVRSLRRAIEAEAARSAATGEGGGP